MQFMHWDAAFLLISISPDWNQTWYTSTPRFTWCFESTVVAWIPCVYLWICFPFYYLYLQHKNNGYIRISHIFKTKMVLGFILVILCFSNVFFALWEISQGIPRAPVFFISPAVVGITMILAMYLIHAERMMGIRSSGILLVFWLLSFMAAVVMFSSKVQHALERNPCPEASSSFLSKITYWWFSGLAWKGCQQSLCVDDLWTVRKEDSSEEIVAWAEREWKKYHSRTQQ
ncbi:multidrug resistance-associated protein 1-like [Numenius arquata]|uniref:multidrug resistance-associated protein 1-like n=1 Tax=Numenius arquata TaxID=31919 RepID=UPI003D303E74